MCIPKVLTPIKHGSFRLLWVVMGASYAGDRPQELAQSWLVASLTQSSAMVGSQKTNSVSAAGLSYRKLL